MCVRCVVQMKEGEEEESFKRKRNERNEHKCTLESNHIRTAKEG